MIVIRTLAAVACVACTIAPVCGEALAGDLASAPFAAADATHAASPPASRLAHAHAFVWGPVWGPYWGPPGFSYQYETPPESYAYAAPAYGEEDAIARCALRYRSFDPVSGTYLGHDGARHRCR